VATVSSILSYPVKSMLGVSADRADLVGSGLAGDRGWALVDLDTGKVASAKHPRWWRALLTLRSELDGARSGDAGSDGGRSDAGPPVVILPDGTRCAAGDPATDRILSDLLGRPVAMRRVREAGAALDRAVPEAVLAEGVEADVPFELLELAQEAPGSTFVDYAPVHLITTATLAAIRSLGEHDADPRRFRPNLVLDTGDAAGFVENDWVGRELTVGDTVRLQVFLPTPRCAVPTLAQGDLGRDPGLLTTLARHNRIEVEGFGRQQSAGVYAKVLVPGPVRLGDPVALV
jgi:hypothetical protein